MPVYLCVHVCVQNKIYKILSLSSFGILNFDFYKISLGHFKKERKYGMHDNLIVRGKKRDRQRERERERKKESVALREPVAIKSMVFK
jgi:hypothetical protein